MGFFTKIKKLFTSEDNEVTSEDNKKVNYTEHEKAERQKASEAYKEEEILYVKTSDDEPIAEELLEENLAKESKDTYYQEVTLSKEEQEAEHKNLRVKLGQADKKLSSWLSIILDGVEERGQTFTRRLEFLLNSLHLDKPEIKNFVNDFNSWLAKMDYKYIDEFKSELQYRLALALDLEDEDDEKNRLFVKLNKSLNKTREFFKSVIINTFSKYTQIGDSFWADLEDVLIMSDMGYKSAIDLTTNLKKIAYEKRIANPEELVPYFAKEIIGLFTVSKRIEAINPPEVVLFVGINGVGKTTTLAKLAYRSKMQGKKVFVIGADTFRAAAIEQLEAWANKIGVDFFSKTHGMDPAAVVYEGMEKGLAEHYDVIYIDTAGRLHTKTALMDELVKVRSVIAKKHAGAPHRTILVVDATTGQNAIQQTQIFSETTDVSEIILTKLDGTAKGGIAIALAHTFKIPITFVGLGEKMDDLRPFDAKDFAKSLFITAKEK